MNNDILDRLADVTDDIKNSTYINDMKKLRVKLLSNKDLMGKINKLKEIDKYSSEYINLKKEIMDNSDYKKYKEYEMNMFYLINTMNKKINELTKEQ